MDTLTRIADYTIIRPLGAGDGSFYLAEPPARLGLATGIQVAVKVLNVSLEPQRFHRVTNELQLFASIQSPHLVTLFDAGHEDGRFFYAMELMPLGSLARPAREMGRAEILRAVADAARGAHALHEAGVAHRDLKPSNVLLHEGGAKLSDLELARFINPGMTVTNTAPVSSVEYTDPAIIKGDRAGRATDIWSLGVTLHWALTGRSVYGEPLPENDVIAAIRRLLSTPPSLDAGLDAAAAAVVGACLAPDATDRPPTALDVAALIDALPAEVVQ